MHKFVRAVAFDFGHTLVREGFVDDRIELMPGVQEVLQGISVPMAVWANTRTAGEMEVRRLLNLARIEQYFSCVVTSVDAGFRKPAAEFFHFALMQSNFRKADVLFVCNQLNTDVLGADAFGISTAWLSGPEFRSQDETLSLDQVRPAFILPRLSGLPSLLEEISF